MMNFVTKYTQALPIFFLLLFSYFFISCNQSGNAKKEIHLDSMIENGSNNEVEQADLNQESAIESVLEPTRECYEYIIQKDTYQISWVQQGKELKGNAVYDNYQKDSSSGLLNGEYDSDNDLYLFWYSFQSEGMRSVRRLAFKKSGDLLIPGFGNMQEKGDTSNFKESQSLSFDKRYAYNKVDCKKIRTIK